MAMIKGGRLGSSSNIVTVVMPAEKISGSSGPIRNSRKVRDRTVAT